jgi:hypothetical protein
LLGGVDEVVELPDEWPVVEELPDVLEPDGFDWAASVFSVASATRIDKILM